MSSVKVVTKVYLAVTGVWMFSEWTMPHVTADIFEPGVLAITAESDGVIVRTFEKPDWDCVSVFDDDGYERFSFTNRRPDPAWEGHVQSRELRRVGA